MLHRADAEGRAVGDNTGRLVGPLGVQAGLVQHRRVEVSNVNQLQLGIGTLPGLGQNPFSHAAVHAAGAGAAGDDRDARIALATLSDAPDNRMRMRMTELAVCSNTSASRGIRRPQVENVRRLIFGRLTAEQVAALKEIARALLQDEVPDGPGASFPELARTDS